VPGVPPQAGSIVGGTQPVEAGGADGGEVGVGGWPPIEQAATTRPMSRPAEGLTGRVRAMEGTSGVDAQATRRGRRAVVGGIIRFTMDQPHRNAALGSEPIRTIGRDELKAKLDRREDVKLIMALNRWAFEAKHIPGSLHFDTPEALYDAIGPDDEVVVYCSHIDCLSSVALYRDLVRRGYRNVRRYSGGLLDWEDAGLPLEGGFVTAG
jgi:rhodanese-related sulfurtransferase